MLFRYFLTKKNKLLLLLLNVNYVSDLNITVCRDYFVFLVGYFELLVWLRIPTP